MAVVLKNLMDRCAVFCCRNIREYGNTEER